MLPLTCYTLKILWFLAKPKKWLQNHLDSCLISMRKYLAKRWVWINRDFLTLSYLGIPLFNGRPKSAFLLPISDKIKARLPHWNGKSLSMARWLTVIKSVITGSFTHSFFIFDGLNSCIRNFLWSDSIWNRKIVTVAWKEVCKNLEGRGLGTRSGDF